MSVSRKPKPQTPKQRMQARRDRLRAQGLRPVQYWVPDLRDPTIQAAIKQEIANLAKHPDNAALDDWIEQASDFSEWK